MKVHFNLARDSHIRYCLRFPTTNIDKHFGKTSLQILLPMNRHRFRCLRTEPWFRISLRYCSRRMLLMGVSKLYYKIHPCRTRAQKNTSIGRHMQSTPMEAHNTRLLMFDSMTLHQLRTIVALQTSRIGDSVIPAQDSQEQISSNSCSYRKLCYLN